MLVLAVLELAEPAELDEGPDDDGGPDMLLLLLLPLLDADDSGNVDLGLEPGRGAATLRYSSNQ